MGPDAYCHGLGGDLLWVDREVRQSGEAWPGRVVGAAGARGSAATIVV